MPELHVDLLRSLYAGWEDQTLTATSIASARMGILDIVGCIIAGAGTPTAAIVREFARSQATGGDATVLGTEARLPAALAALVNGVAGHVLDYDDMSSTFIGHPSVVLVPALLALGETHGSTGRAVLSAYVFGFEVDSHFGRAMIPHHYDRGWHATSSLGILGAAASAAKLLDLSENQMLNALGIAASGVAGLRGNFGSMTKSLHAGNAAEGGVRAAMLAARGFTANPGLFDAENGFFTVYGADPTPKPAPPGGAMEIDHSGLGIKPHACCGAGISLIDAVLDLRRQHGLDAGQVQSLDCRVTDMATRIMPLDRAANGLEAKYCLRYCAAVALLDDKGGLAQFDDDRVARPDVQDLMNRVTVRSAPHLVSGAGRFGVEVTAALKAGGAVESRLELPLGHPLRPVSESGLLDKFRECTVPVLGASRTDELAAAIGALESAAELREIMTLTRPTGPAAR